MKKLTESELFLYLKRKHRLDLENRKNKKRIKKVQKKTPYNSNILNLLQDNLLLKKLKHKRFRNVNIPQNFSFIDNPIDTLQIIKQLATYTRLPIKIKGISINHFNVESIDLAAETILDLTVLEMEKEIKSHNRKFELKGQYPKDKHLKRFIRAIGIVKNLDIKHELLSKDEEKDLRIFKMRNSKFFQKDNIEQSDYKENTVADFVDHINSCLISNGRELKPEAKIKLADYTGEIISNVEDHTDINEWSVVGYLDNSGETHACEITIFNFGNTMSTTLRNLPKDHYTRKVISPYIELHNKSGWFSAEWNENDLLTLIALQGDISSKNTNEQMDRGQGTVEMIDFFQQMHKECINKGKSCAKMAILSGSTHILFDGHYSMSSVNGRNVIAFNKDNDLNQMPDKKYITNLGDKYFPGTIISIRFPLQDTQTQRA